MPQDPLQSLAAPDVFSDYLRPPTYQASQQKPSGFEGPVGSIAHFASAFLSGLSQGRANAYAKSEQKRSQSERSLAFALNAVQNSNLPDAMKQQQMAPLMEKMGLLLHNSIPDGKSKGKKGGDPANGGGEDQQHPGHHILSAMKGMLGNMLGPGAEKQTVDPQEIDKLTHQTFKSLADHENSVQAQVAKADQVLAGRVKELNPNGGIPSREESLRDSDFQRSWGAALAANNGQPTPWMQQFEAAQAEQEKRNDPAVKALAEERTALAASERATANKSTLSAKMQSAFQNPKTREWVFLSPKGGYTDANDQPIPKGDPRLVGLTRASTAAKDPAESRKMEWAFEHQSDPPGTPSREAADTIVRESQQKIFNAEVNASGKGQEIAIKAEETGIGGGRGAPPGARSSTKSASPPGAPQTKAEKISSATPTTVPTTKSVVAATVDTRTREDMDFVMNGLLGLTNKPSGRSPMMARWNRGLSSLEKSTGLSGEELSARVLYRSGTAKSLVQNTERIGAFSSLENRVNEMGTLLETARKKVPNYNVWLNKVSQNIAQNYTGDPDTSRLVVAANAMAREYAQVLSNGFQSRAQIPVSSQEDAQKAIAAYFKTGQINAIVDQLQQETVANKRGMVAANTELFKQLSQPLTEQTPGPPAKEASGDHPPAANNNPPAGSNNSPPSSKVEDFIKRHSK